MTEQAACLPSKSYPENGVTMNRWGQCYAVEGFIFGTGPHDSVRRVQPCLPATDRALDLAMGEGCNSVFLVQCGLNTEGVDNSPVAVAGAEKMATLKGVDLAMRVADITAARTPPEHYAVISSVYCHFTESVRSRLTRGIVGALVSNDLFIGAFYHPEQATLEKGPKD